MSFELAYFYTDLRNLTKIVLALASLEPEIRKVMFRFT